MTTRKKAKTKRPRKMPSEERFYLGNGWASCEIMDEERNKRVAGMVDVYIATPSDFLRFERWLVKAKAWVLEKP